MKTLLLSFLLLICIPQSNGQNFFSKSSALGSKPAIDFTAIDHYAYLGLGTYGDVFVSNDGKYLSYRIENQPFQSNTLVIQSTSGSWKQEFVGAKQGSFSMDSKEYIFKSNDTLYFLKAGTNELNLLPRVLSYRTQEVGSDEWVAYQKMDEPKKLILQNLDSSKKFQFDYVKDFSFGKSGTNLLINQVLIKGNSCRKNLLFIDLLNDKETEIWATLDSSKSISGFAFDDSSTQIVFTQCENDDQTTNSLWYYKNGMMRAVLKADGESASTDTNFYIKNGAFFTHDGRYIFFDLAQKTHHVELLKNAAHVDIWNYRDSVLQSAQLETIEKKEPTTYFTAINVESSKIIKVQQANETVDGYKGDFVVCYIDSGGDRFWDKEHIIRTYWLISLKDGSRIKLPIKDKWILDMGSCFSPGGNFIVFRDGARQFNYFSYDVDLGKLTKISTGVPLYTFARKDEFGNLKSSSDNGIAGWVEEKSSVLVYDNYDIWQLDLSGKIPPCNITNGYGRMHKIKLRLTERLAEEPRPFHIKDRLLLVAFNSKSKYNGFYAKVLGVNGDPKVLYMGPCVFDLIGTDILPGNSNDFYQGKGMMPIKARDASVWIVKRMSYNDAPNYFATSDFASFRNLSNIEPHKNYNWLTAELISFRQLDGTSSQGVLYKPENFDPRNKYPIIISYYEQSSHRLYQYPTVEYINDAHLNIPWLVSRGYLVFTPDIYFEKWGERAVSAFDAVVGAAKFFTKQPFVDPKKMGISGHSRAGGFTNYILTHTGIFSAVLEGAGISDKISDALFLYGGHIFSGDGASRLGSTEEYYNNGIGIWQNINLWLQQSPILRADRVSTPLLIFHNKLDAAVPWQNGLELFTALRRLDKPVWMLQYDGETHDLDEINNQQDFTIRVTQFFDHFLKHTAAPIWMTRGVPASQKGIDPGLSLDK